MKRKTVKIEVAKELASCVLWALQFMDTRGGGLVINLKTGESEDWHEKFLNALDGYGYVIDRKAYYEAKDKKSRRRRAA